MLDRLNSPGFFIKFEKLSLFAINFGSYLKSFSVNYFNYSLTLQFSLDVELFIKTKSILTWIGWFIKPCWSHFLIRFCWGFFAFVWWWWSLLFFFFLLFFLLFLFFFLLLLLGLRLFLFLFGCRFRLLLLWWFRFNLICISNSPFLAGGPLLVSHNDLTAFIIFLSLDVNEFSFFIDYIISLDLKHLEPS